MSKILLFVCLAFGTVLGQTQMRFLNAQYDGNYRVGLTPDLLVIGNTTLTSGLIGNYETTSFPDSGYLALPQYEWTVGTWLDIHAFNRDAYVEPPIDVSFASLINVTLVELQSYSVVYVGASDEFSIDPRIPLDPAQMFIVEERPNPSPVGKALVRVVNVALSTIDQPLEMTVKGTQVDQVATLAFGEVTDFLEYNEATTLMLYTNLPSGTAGTNRTIQFTTEIGSTTMIYLRGDITSPALLGQVVNKVAFAFPEPPSAPVAPPTAPVAAPTTAEPNAAAPVAAPAAPVAAPTATPTRAPTRRVSSASVAVAQIAGVACVMALLF